jgi:protein-L-isoaspartate O-methyltransferase
MVCRYKFCSNFIKKFSTSYWLVIDNLAYKLDKLADYYYKKSIGAEYIKEYNLFKINEKDKVLHIGSGAFPLTEIMLAEVCNTNVIGIDKNIKAVEKARDVLKKRKLLDKIEIITANGTDFSVSNFDVIIVSSCATPMINILKNIIATSKNNSKLIVREMETSAAELIKYIDNNIDIKKIDKIEHNPFPFVKPFGWISFYFLKKTGK